MADEVLRLWNLFTAAQPFYTRLLQQQFPQHTIFVYLVFEVGTGGGAFVFVADHAQYGLIERHMQFETIKEGGDLVLADLVYIATSKYLA